MDVYGLALAINSVCLSMSEQYFVSYEGVAHSVLYVICVNVVLILILRVVSLSLSFSLCPLHTFKGACAPTNKCVAVFVLHLSFSSVSVFGFLLLCCL